MPAPPTGAGPFSPARPMCSSAWPAARVTDKALCPRSPPDALAEGEATVLIGGRPAARMGDRTVHGGVVVSGCTTVWIGANAGRCLAEAAQSGAAFVSAMED
ncbi:PAAR domain-containing protein [Delftia acidovorans]|uniref:PAAR domain-containing protein n=1 Tax=Delftia acidovorans TaxID=80866 RepID=UPI00333E6137